MSSRGSGGSAMGHVEVPSHGPAADGVTGLTLSLSTREETTEVDIGTISAPQVLFPQVAVPVGVAKRVLFTAKISCAGTVFWQEQRFFEIKPTESDSTAHTSTTWNRNEFPFNKAIVAGPFLQFRGVRHEEVGEKSFKSAAEAAVRHEEAEASSSAETWCTFSKPALETSSDEKGSDAVAPANWGSEEGAVIGSRAGLSPRPRKTKRSVSTMGRSNCSSEDGVKASESMPEIPTSPSRGLSPRGPVQKPPRGRRETFKKMPSAYPQAGISDNGDTSPKAMRRCISVMTQRGERLASASAGNTEWTHAMGVAEQREDEEMVSVPCWRTSAVVVTRLASSVNRVSLASKRASVSATANRRVSLHTSTSTFAPELHLVGSWETRRVSRTLLTTVDVPPDEGDADGEELAMSVWRFDWTIPLLPREQKIEYEVVYAGKSTKEQCLSYFVPPMTQSPSFLTVPTSPLETDPEELAAMNEKQLAAHHTEVRDALEATWRYAVQDHTNGNHRHVATLLTDLVEFSREDADEVVDNTFSIMTFGSTHPDLSSSDANKSKMQWRPNKKTCTHPHLKTHWPTSYYGDVVVNAAQRKRMFAMAIIKMLQKITNPSFASIVARVPTVCMWPANVGSHVDVLVECDSTVVDVCKEAFCLLWLGKLPAKTESLSTSNTPAAAFHADGDTISDEAGQCSTLRHSLMSIGRAALLVIDLPEKPMSPELALAKLTEMCKHGEEEQKPTTLHIRSTRTFFESDQEVVESVYSISERLQLVEEAEREEQRQSFVFLRALFQFIRECKCSVYSLNWNAGSRGLYEVCLADDRISVKLTQQYRCYELPAERPEVAESEDGDTSSATATSSQYERRPADGGIPMASAPSLYSASANGAVTVFYPSNELFTSYYITDSEPNPWLEPQTGIWNLQVDSRRYEDYYNVKLGSLNCLVQRLVTPPSTEEHQSLHDSYDLYVKMFFMTYRAFVSSNELLRMILAFFEPPPGMAPMTVTRYLPVFPIIQNAVCKLLVHWFNHHFNDFKNQKPLMTTLQSFVDSAFQVYERNKKLGVSGEVKSMVPYLKSLIEKKAAKGTYQSMFDASVVVHDPPKPIEPDSWRGATFMDLDDLEIARQLTIEQFHIYVEIQPVEFQNLAWSKEKYKHRAENLLSLIGIFNDFSSKCATLILSTKTLKKRKLVVEKLIRIAQNLVDLNNFNMAMSIISAFNSSAVHRLKFTFEGLAKKSSRTLQQLNELMSSEGAYRNIRKAVSTAKPPCIPFLGVYLTDLTFVEDGNPNKVRSLINFRKRQLEYDIIVQILAFQGQVYNLTMVHKMVGILRKMEMLGGDDLYKLSLECEPRKATKKMLA